jgi:hypothetical protein
MQSKVSRGRAALRFATRSHTMTRMNTAGKYEPLMLVRIRIAAEARTKMVNEGFTDNGGAIHSAERILNILGQRLCYPGLSHINKLRHHPGAAFSAHALSAHEAGEPVRIEHVAPHRALTARAIDKIVKHKATDQEFIAFVKRSFRLALLTTEETERLNKINRSSISARRLESAGIRLAVRRAKEPGKRAKSSVQPSRSSRRAGS